MGMIVIEENKTLNLAQYGLEAGDTIDVICVGGGGGGGRGAGNDSSKVGNGGNAGNGGKYGGYSGGGGAGAGYGAGGGGGGSMSTANYRGGDGGNAGEYKITSHVLNNTTVNSIAVTIGAAGLGGNFLNAVRYNGTNGGITSFGTILSANGGNGGRSDGDSTATNSCASGGVGGAGGFILPMKYYGGYSHRRRWVPNTGAFNNNFTYPFGQEAQIMSGAGGCGGQGSSITDDFYARQAQGSLYGGTGGGVGESGTKGTMSKGEGVVVVTW